jgi:uncharacterized protein YcgL (UPF0745 family)
MLLCHKVFCLLYDMTTKDSKSYLFVIRRSDLYDVLQVFVSLYNAIENVPERKWKGTEWTD